MSRGHIYARFTKRLGREYYAVVAQLYMTGMGRSFGQQRGSVPLLALASALIAHGQATALRYAPVSAWLSLGSTVLFGAVAGFGLWFWLIARCSLARVAPFSLLQTVFGIWAGFLLLGEPAAAPLVAGGLACMAGVALTQLQPRARFATQAELPASNRRPV